MEKMTSEIAFFQAGWSADALKTEKPAPVHSEGKYPDEKSVFLLKLVVLVHISIVRSAELELAGRLMLKQQRRLDQCTPKIKILVEVV